MAIHSVTPDYSSAAHRLLYGATSRNLPLEPLLAKAGIDPASLADPNLRLRGQQYLRLLRTLSTELGDEFFALSRRPSKKGTFAMMAKTGLHCETLKAFIEHCCEFYRLTTDDLEFSFRLEGDTAIVGVHQTEPAFDPHQFLAEYWLLHLHRMFSWVAGFMIPLLAVNFTDREPPGPQRLIYYLRSDWQSGQAANSFVFHAKYLSLPVVKTLPELKEHISPDLNKAPSWPDDVLTWSSRVKARLKQTFDNRQPPEDINQVAGSLCTTSRSLRRHLRDEGTTYQQVLDDIRRDLAIEKLHFQHLPVADVAEQLGFSEPRSFSRAFKQWTGTSPRRYQADSTT